MRNLLYNIVRLPRNLIVSLITLYQQTLSPDHGPLKHLHPYGFCRHSPTCSAYAKEIIQKRGVLIGIPLSVWRLLTCNPFTKLSDEKIARLTESPVRQSAGHL